MPPRGVCAAALVLSGATAWAADVTPDRLTNAGTDAEAGNWLMVGKTYNSNRFSTLNAINASNVAGLHVITAAPLGGSEPGGFGVGGQPVEMRGVAVQGRHPGGPEAGEDLALGVRDRGERGEVLDMGGQCAAAINYLPYWPENPGLYWQQVDVKRFGLATWAVDMVRANEALNAELRRLTGANQQLMNELKNKRSAGMQMNPQLARLNLG